MELDQKIIELKTSIKERDSIERKLREANLERQKLTSKKDELHTQLIKEESDVKKLESASLVSFWYSLLGTKSDKLNKEREEEYRARSDYMVASNMLDQINQEVKEYKSKLNKIKSYEEELKTLLKEKEMYVHEHDEELSTQIHSLNNDVVNHQHRVKEIDEAIHAGNKLLSSIEYLSEVLNKARGWGTFDIFGGGLLSDIAKHNHLSNAKNQLKNIHYEVNKFSRELKDVNYEVNIDIDISDSLKFFDFFFDGIFADLAVQSRINKAIDQVNSGTRSIKRIINKLVHEREHTFTQVNDLKKRKNELLSPKQ